MTTLRLPILKVIKYIVEKTSAVTWHRDLPLRGPSSDSEVHRGYHQGYGQDTGILYIKKINNHLLHHNCSIEGLTLHRWNITAICIIIKCHLRIFFINQHIPNWVPSSLTPGFRKEFSDCRCSHLTEERPSVYAAEMWDVSEEVQLIRHHC